MNLVEGLLKEIDRCTEVKKHYLDIGPAGMLGAAMIQAEIDQAKRVLGEGDTIAMLGSHKALQEIES